MSDWKNSLRAMRRLAAAMRSKSTARTLHSPLKIESLESRQVMTASFVGGLLSDVSIAEGSAAVFRFSVADDTLPANALALSVASADQAVLADSALSLTDFGGGDWQLTVQSPTSGIGSSTITLTLTGDGAPVVKSFSLSIVEDANAYSRVSSNWFTELQTPTRGGSLSGSSTGDSSGAVVAADGSSEWIVRLTSQALENIRSVTEAAAALADSQLGISVVAGLGLPGQLLLRGTATVAELRQYFSTNTAFAYFDQNLVKSITATPNDPSYGTLDGLNNVGQTAGKVDADIDASEAWSRTTGSRSIVVGIIDTGIDYNHVDLAANIWTNPGEVAGNGLDDDANGFVDDIHGYDFVNNDGNPLDDNGHGTHVAGTVGAVGNNGVGVVGVNWAVSMMAIKFLDASGEGTSADAIRAVNYATMMRNTYGVNVRVTNNSWGGDENEQGLLDAINAAGQSNILFVAAAGNDGLNIDQIPSYPGGWESQYIVTVAATDRNDVLASFSNYGATAVDLAAPGVSILSTGRNNTYQTLSGTSMATPHVAGAAALALSLNPNLSAVELKALLLNNVDPIASLAGRTVSGGRLNVNNVVDAAGMTATVSSPAAGSIVFTKPTSFTVDFSAAYDPASVAAADFTVNGVAADAFTIVDSNTITFTFNTSPVTVSGVQTMAIAGGALRRLSDATASIAYGGTFRYNVALLAPIAATPTNGSIVPLPFTTLDLQFNEAVDAASIDIGDLVVSQGTVVGATALNPTTARYTLSGATAEATFTYSAAAGALVDVFGTPGAAFSGTYTLDYGVVPIASPLVPVGPSPAMVYHTAMSSTIGYAGDSDGFSIAVEAGQTLAVAVKPTAASLRPTVEIRDASNNVVATATATAAGQGVLLQAVKLATAGTYTIYVSGADSTTGAQTVEVTLNAAIDAEIYGGATNNTRVTAQSLDGLFVAIDGSSSRAAVVGTASTSDEDYYSFTLTAGETVSLSVMGLGGVLPTVYLMQGTTTVAASNTNQFDFLTQEIYNYVAPVSGTYYARIISFPADYSLVITRNIALSARTNDSLAAAQTLGGSSGAVIGSLGVEGTLGRLYAYDRSAGLIRELDPLTGANLNSFAPPAGFTVGTDAGLATTPSSLLLASSNSTTIYELNPVTGALIRTITSLTSNVSGLAYNYGEIYVKGPSGTTITVVDYTAGTIKRTFSLSDIGANLAASPDYLYSVSSGALKKIFPDSGTLFTSTTLSGAGASSGLGIIGNELFVGTSTTIRVYDLDTLAFKRALTTSFSAAAAIGADGGRVDNGDFYSVELDAGGTLQLSTSTPGDAVGQISNDVDPVLTVYDAASNVVASDDNSAADGRNATLSYTAAAAGKYTIRVTQTAAGQAAYKRGEYVLTYSGVVAPSTEFKVASTSLAASSIVKSSFTQLTVFFNDKFDTSKLQAGDLLVNGTAATGLTYDQFTAGATFTFTQPTVGMVQFTIAAGAILDLQQTPLTAFSLQVDFHPNTAPTLVISPAMVLNPITEEDITNNGTLIADLLATGAGGNPISDVDTSDGRGIAITTAVTSKGTWEFSLNNGTTWTALGSPSTSSARTLAADSQTRIRLKPSANANGTLTPALTFRAWDMSTGTNGGTSSVSSSGGATAFSTAAATASIAVTNINDAPSFTKGANQIVGGDGLAKSVSNWATSISQGPLETGQSLTFLVTNDNNSLFTVQPTISSSGTLTYTTVVGAGGSAVVSVRLMDDAGTALGGADTSAVQTFTITSTPSPTITTIADQTIVEDGNTGPLAFSVADADTPLGSLVVTTSASNTLIAPAAGRVVTNLGNGNYQLVVTPLANQFGTSTVTVTVSDGSGSTSMTFTLTVAPVNDLPAFVKGGDWSSKVPTETTVLGWASGLSAGGETQTLSFVVSVDDPTLFSVLPTVSSNGTLKFTPAVGKSGVANVSLYVMDDGGTANGGIDRSAPQTFKITVSTMDIAPFALDPTFGTAGVLSQSWTASQDYFYDVAVQDDGKFIVVGMASSSMVAARYFADGTIDTTFGTNGRATISTATNVAPASVVFQPDGKIIVVGQSTLTPSASVYRLLANGTLDTTFGTGGAVTISTFGPAWDAVVGSDGSIFIVTKANNTYKLSSTGTVLWSRLDGTYSGYAIAQQADGKILVGGGNGDSASAGTLSRLNADGTYDLTFGSSGKLFISSYVIRDILPQADGKFLAIASASTFGTKVAVLRYNADGTLDSTFGTAGAATYDTLVSDLAFRGYMGTGGSIYLVGSNGGEAMVLHFTANGELDTVFDAGSLGNRSIVAGSATTFGPAGAVLPGDKFMFFGTELTPASDLLMMQMYRVASNSTITPISDQTIDEGGFATVDFTVDDSDTPVENLVVTALSSDDTILPASGLVITDLGGGNRRLTFTPAADRFGTVRVSVYASDGRTPTKQSFLLTINPVNDAPSFVKGADQSLLPTTTPQTVAGWATSLSVGAFESGQALNLLVTNDNNSLFSVQPTISPAGVLTYTPSGLTGTAIVSVRIHDDGGTTGGGFDTSAVQTFVIELVPPPRVLTSSIQKDDVRGAAFSLVVTFSAAMKAANLDASDFKLRGNLRAVDYTATAASFDPSGTTLTLDFAGLLEDSYTLTLFSADDRFESALGRNLDGETTSWPLPVGGSGDGLDGGDFAVTFSVDGASNPIPVPFTALPLDGSMAYQSTPVSVYFGGPTDSDDLTLALDAGQTISVSAQSSLGLQTALSILDPNGVVLGTFTQSSLDTKLYTTAVAVPIAGTYTLRFSSINGVVGTSTVTVTLNAALEAESQSSTIAAQNNTLATAQNVDAAFTDLGDGASRAAVIGGLTAVAPITENFQNSFLNSSWSTYSSQSGGRIQLTNTYGTRSAPFALYMDTTTGTSTLNEAVWTVNLASAPEAVLSFWHLDQGDEETAMTAGNFTGHSNGDGVAFSADGTTWRTLWSAPNQSSGTWTQYSFDLKAAAAAAGFALNSQFKIKFQQYDDLALPSDGRAWDDISIATAAIDADYYSISLAAGDSLSLALRKQSGSASLQVALQDAGGNVVAVGSTQIGFDSVITDYQAATAGTYYIVVSGSGTTTYDLAATRNAAFEAVPNDILQTAMNVGALRTVVGYATVGSDYYTFQVDYDTILTLATTTPGDAPGEFNNALDPAIELYDSTGNLIGSNTDGAADGRNARLSQVVAPGAYTVRVFATTGTGEYILKASEAPTSAVPSVLPITDAVIDEDGTATIDFHVTDADTDLLSLTLGVSSDDGVLLPPSGLVLTNLGGGDYRLVATPSAHRNGTATLTISVSDGSRPITLTFQLTVAPLNDAPSFVKGGDQITRAGSSPVVIADWAQSISQGPFESGQTLTFEVVAADPSLFLVGPAISSDGTLTYTPANLLGTTTVTVVLRDTGGTTGGGVAVSAPQVFNISVTAAPTIAPITDQTVNEDGTLTVDVTVSDLDSPFAALTIAATAADKTLLPDARISAAALGGGVWRITLSPATDRFGSTVVTVTADDGNGTVASGTFNLNVVGVNDPPSFVKGSDRAVNGDAGPQTIANWASGLSQGPNESGQTLTFEVTTDNPAIFSSAPQIDPAGTLTYTPSGVFGTATVTVVLRDSLGAASAPQTFKIQVGSFTADGLLDPTFDGDGIARLQSQLGSTDIGRDIARQADGKYVVVSQITLTAQFGYSRNSAVTRFDADGTLDAAFGVGGTVQFGLDVRLFSVEVLSNGKLIVAGESNGAFYVTRLNVDGSVDTTFGVAGVATLNVNVSNPVPGNSPVSLAIQADGGIVVSKSTFTNLNTATIARFTSSGAVDTTFNGIGYRIFASPNPGPGATTPYDVLVQADGKLVMVGTTPANIFNSDYFVARFTTTGAIDTTFGGGLGYVTVNFGSVTTFDTATRVVQQTDGKLVVGGTATNSFGLVRLNTDGTFDTAFGTSGQVTTTTFGSSQLLALVIQTDGKIVAGGAASSPGQDLAIARYTSTGALDTFFDTGDGTATRSIGSGVDQIHALLVEPDGKITVAGVGTDTQNNGDTLIARFNQFGFIDTTFNGVGWNLVGSGTSTARATATLALADGRVLVGGFFTNGSSTTAGRRAVWMLRADGSLDTSFGVDGIVLSASGAGGVATSLAVQSDGKFLVLDGSISRLIRLNSNGTVDTTFATSGTLALSPTILNVVSVQVQADGRILVAGTKTNSNVDVAVARYTAAGVLDTSFDGDGLALADFGTGDELATSMTVQSDGKILVAGFAASGGNDFALARWNVDGTLDTTFSGDGKLVQPIGPSNTFDRARSVIVQADGKIVVAGVTSSSNSDVALVRYLADGTPDTSFSGDGIQTTSFSAGSDDVATVLQQVDGRLVVVGFSAMFGTRVAVARYLSDGSLDTSLDNDGILLTPLGSASAGQAAAMQADGRLIVAGYAERNARYDAATLRYIISAAPSQVGPTVTPIADRSLDENGAASIDFSVAHPTLPDASLVITVSSSDAVLFPSAGLVVTDLGGGVRRLTVTPAHDRTGSALITITVSDGTYTYAETLTLTVVPAIPVVTGVYARGVGTGSANWNASFLNYLAGTLDGTGKPLGDATLGFLLSSGGTQLKTLSWTNVNTISIRFNKELVIAREDLTITASGNGPAVPAITGFSWDSATHTGTWTFAAALPRQKYLLHLNGTLLSTDGQALDGEWTVASSQTSGNGTAGGDFNFRFNVLPGDFDGNNGVTITEVLAARNRAGKGTASVGYAYREDIDGNGNITITEVLASRNRTATSITGLNEPVAPGSTPQSPLELAPLIPGDEDGLYVSPYTSLTEAELAPIVDEAIARWEASGLVPKDFDWSKLRFAITDLGPAYLGLGNPDGAILLDDDGAGWGWFVDGSPSEDGEFASSTTDAAAAAHMDLLTVVMHEIGHALGYPTGSAQDTPAAALMSEFLGVGARRTPGVAPAEPHHEPDLAPADLLAAGSFASAGAGPSLTSWSAAVATSSQDYAIYALSSFTADNNANIAQPDDAAKPRANKSRRWP